MFSRQFVKMVFACAPALLTPMAIGQSSPGDSQGGQSAIEGTWIQTITPAGAPAGFTALVWFSAGGATGATGTADRNSPFASAAAPQSVLIGSFKCDNNVCISTLPFFSFDAGGNALNMYKNYITYWLTDYNTIKGIGKSVKCDPDGTHCSPYGSITITGTRLIPQGAN